jgi:hypothetical protein
VSSASRSPSYGSLFVLCCAATLTIRRIDSEPSYFYYQGKICNELRYLVAEAFPDWKRKVASFEKECSFVGIPMDVSAAQSEVGADLAKWFAALKAEVQEWEQRAKAVEIPSFKQAVADLVAMKSTQEELKANSTPSQPK